MMPKPTAGLRVRIHRSPEEQARIDDLHRSIGASLARNLNASVLHQEHVAEFRRFMRAATKPPADSSS